MLLLEKCLEISCVLLLVDIIMQWNPVYHITCLVVPEHSKKFEMLYSMEENMAYDISYSTKGT